MKINTAKAEEPQFSVRLAKSSVEVTAAQHLRYRVFVQELGSDGPMVDHGLQLERDHFDAFAAHVILFDHARPDNDQVVGTYRLMTEDMATKAGRFYCEDEYDLTPLHENGGRLLELGRSCLHPDYRGGAGMLQMWGALASYVAQHQIDILFGVASFHGTDPQPIAPALSLLHHRHLAPDPVRVSAIGPSAVKMDQIPPADLDRLAAAKALPALIKAYLRLGATVGQGAFVDHAFNTTDVCIILQRDAIGALQRSILAKGRTNG